MRFLAGSILSLLMVCAASAQQTNQNVQSENSIKKSTEQSKSAQEIKGIFAERAVVCLNVNSNEPEGEGDTFAPNIKLLYCFTHIKSSEIPAEIQHNWYWNDKLMASIPLKVNFSSYRTKSSKTIPENSAGEWRVEIVNTNNKEVIKVLKFLIK